MIGVSAVIEVGVGRGIDHDATGHAHDVADAYLLSWVVLFDVPLWNRCGLP